MVHSAAGGVVTGWGGTERKEKGSFGEKPTDNRRAKRPKNKKRKGIGEGIRAAGWNKNVRNGRGEEDKYLKNGEGRGHVIHPFENEKDDANGSRVEWNGVIYFER